MGADTPQLPVIYLSDQTLKPGGEKWVEVRSDVRKALEDYGAFEVSYDRVSEELKKSVLDAMIELFELPVEAKQRNVSPKPYTGYSTHNGLSESLGIQDSNVLEKVNEFTQLLRPDCEGNKSMRSNAGCLMIHVYDPKKRTWRSVVAKPPFNHQLDFRTTVMCTIRL
ncbi:hypothetical protein DY000_02010922 [Brassica cretica]|uniref:Non-haem dioxygenase N-terminal domain-containing protein n=1 Tax=Brassica cretica TaxID=69181 RepID=A0ABQ7CLH0_BRACR|nr:hypothetical protein DY000_02010922 [Brassica cretica]